MHILGKGTPYAGLLMAAALAVFVAGSLAPAAVYAQSAAVQTKTESDYAEFRKLAEPLRIVDVVAALAVGQVYRDDTTRNRSEKWKKTFIASLDRRINNRRAALTDVLMREAFKSFTPQDTPRLTQLCAMPALARFQAAKIAALRSGGNYDTALYAFRDELVAQNLPQADIQLLASLLYASGTAIAKDEKELPAIIQGAWKEADAATR